MRLSRLILALLIATSLSVLPMSTGMRMTHAAMADMSMGAPGDKCPCCNPAHKCSPDDCLLVCYSAPAISTTGLILADPLPEHLVAFGPAMPAPFLRQPDPRPPRF